MKKIEDYIVSVPDFPKPGILFRDVTGILSDPDGLKLTCDAMCTVWPNRVAGRAKNADLRHFKP